MPRRLIRALAFYRPTVNRGSPDLPTKTMWTTTLPDGAAVLIGHPIFQLAPLGNVREQMLTVEPRILKEVRLDRDGPVEALIWTAPFWVREETYALADSADAVHDPYHPDVPRTDFGPYWHWIGMTRDRVWKDCGGDRDHLVLGSYLHLLEGLDPAGDRILPDPAGELPEGDEEALGDLAP
ncbi:hypothetical protein ACFQE0_14105 [Methylobacterium komagatae]|uniref:Uncharacterized protein n=1 Tax=Methylobacterium komagatae TaxID=374425 RepID=A0ABW2BJP0_9HYPH